MANPNEPKNPNQQQQNNPNRNPNKQHDQQPLDRNKERQQGGINKKEEDTERKW